MGNRAAELISELQTYSGQSCSGFGKDVISVVNCQVEVSATGWSLIQGSPTVVCVCVRARSWAGGRACVSLSVVKCKETLDFYSEYVARGQPRNERWKMMKRLILHLFV